MEHTQNYQLSQWSGEDFIRMEDFNGDNEKIEAALTQLERTAVSLAYCEGQLALRDFLTHGKSQLGQRCVYAEPFLTSGAYECSDGVTVADHTVTLRGQATGTVTTRGRAMYQPKWSKAVLWVHKDFSNTGLRAWLNGTEMTRTDVTDTFSSFAPVDTEMVEFVWTGEGSRTAQVELELDRKNEDHVSVYDFVLFVY